MLPMSDAERDERVHAHLAAEAARPEHEVRPEYAQRLTAALDRWVHVPVGHPVRVPDSSDREFSWIDPRHVVVVATFHPYNHTRKEILEYAIRERGNASQHLRDMRLGGGFWVEELPSPGPDPIYRVTNNGNHRRLVFEMLGLPFVHARVAPCLPDQWSMIDDQWSGSANAGMIDVFTHLNLVTVTVDEYAGDDPRAWRITDPTRCMGWVWPSRKDDPMLAAWETTQRLRHLEHITGPVTDPRVDVLRDPHRLARIIAEVWEWPMPRRGLVDRLRRREPLPASFPYREPITLPDAYDTDGKRLAPNSAFSNEVPDDLDELLDTAFSLGYGRGGTRGCVIDLDHLRALRDTRRDGDGQ